MSRAVGMVVVAAGCGDTSAPDPRHLVVPETITVPLQLSAAPMDTVATPLALLADGEGSADSQSAEGAMAIGYTEVDINASDASGNAETTFYATQASHDFTLTTWKDGAQVGSATYPTSFAVIFPVSHTIRSSGSIPAPTCGAVATGSTTHTWAWYSLIDNTPIRLVGGTFGSNATRRKQPACPTTLVTIDSSSSGGGGGGDAGYILSICTTTYYYSASGQYLYSTRACRQEYHAQ